MRTSNETSFSTTPPSPPPPTVHNSTEISCSTTPPPPPPPPTVRNSTETSCSTTPPPPPPTVRNSTETSTFTTPPPPPTVRKSTETSTFTTPPPPPPPPSPFPSQSPATYPYTVLTVHSPSTTHLLNPTPISTDNSIKLAHPPSPDHQILPSPDHHVPLQSVTSNRLLRLPPWKGVKPIPLGISVFVGLILRFAIPKPHQVSNQAWQLLAIFLTTITGLIFSPLPAGAWTIVCLTLTVITKTLKFAAAFSAFTNEIIWLIIASFFFSRGVVKTGLGDRIALSFVRWLGKSTLGLSYGLVLGEALISPAVPSSTARAGGIFLPIIKSLSQSAESWPKDKSARKLGAYLIQSQLQGQRQIQRERERTNGCIEATSMAKSSTSMDRYGPSTVRASTNLASPSSISRSSTSKARSATSMDRSGQQCYFYGEGGPV
ncbi:unnamed protein product [Ilex paraguariensis]|uniref:Uncharacterized protein n=1 Tax=Ilex paraguariensis TaxID=185542 RepID=A0ABC8TVG3_9AQUA